MANAKNVRFMMRNDLAEIVMVVDRSGSMSFIRDDAQGGINQFIEDQQKEDGDCNFTLVEFDHQYNFVYSGVPIKDVKHYHLRPRGSTALLDAIGRAINETGERLRDMKEADRPGMVEFVIVTDGAENASSEFNREEIKQMIERQTNIYNWEFTFLAAHRDAVAPGGGIGIRSGRSANYTAANTSAVYSNMSGKMSQKRRAVASGQSAKSVDIDMSAEDREELTKE